VGGRTRAFDLTDTQSPGGDNCQHQALTGPAPYISGCRRQLRKQARWKKSVELIFCGDIKRRDVKQWAVCIAVENAGRVSHSIE